ncbi:MAG: TetR/AcrR family transcriptional regulator [Bacteroidota bacterium]
MTKKQEDWIHVGYRIFAYEGPQKLKVERLAKQVGKNKSSFYHFFADLVVFTEQLLAFHMEQAYIMAEKEAQCPSLDALIDIIVEHKVDLLFNRQLRIHRTNPDFEACFEKTNELTGPALIGIWAKTLNLEDNSYLAGLVMRLGIENFYLQITDETINKEWLSAYFQEFQQLVQAFKSMKGLPTLDGTV